MNKLVRGVCILISTPPCLPATVRRALSISEQNSPSALLCFCIGDGDIALVEVTGHFSHQVACGLILIMLCRSFQDPQYMCWGEVCGNCPGCVTRGTRHFWEWGRWPDTCWDAKVATFHLTQTSFPLPLSLAHYHSFDYQFQMKAPSNMLCRPMDLSLWFHHCPELLPSPCLSLILECRLTHSLSTNHSSEK